MIDITILIIIILCLSFWGAFGGLIKFWYKERKSKKEFDERQERYKRMI